MLTDQFLAELKQKYLDTITRYNAGAFVKILKRPAFQISARP
ncbi:MAG: hypothetical protein NTV89_05355 [Proteobacteria bacterium]|nr:hypothetical protein [Pseudomonadota bacterium]